MGGWVIRTAGLQVDQSVTDQISAGQPPWAVGVLATSLVEPGVNDKFSSISEIVYSFPHLANNLRLIEYDTMHNDDTLA